jgi:hypothetical protein
MMFREYKVVRIFDQGGDKRNIETLDKLTKEGWIPIRETASTPYKLTGVFWLVVFGRDRIPDEITV